MSGFWTARMEDSLRKASTAPTDDICRIYLALTEHYRSMSKLYSIIGVRTTVDLPQYKSDISASVISLQMHGTTPTNHQ